MAQSVQLKKVNHWHRELALWFISNPTATGRETAEHFKVTEAWLSSVKNSDVFVDYFNELSREHASGVLLSVQNKMLGTAEMAVDEIARRIAAKPDAIPFGDLLEATDILTKRAIPEGPRGPATVVNINQVTRDELAAARARMRGEGAQLAHAPPPRVEHDGGPVLDLTPEVPAHD